MPRTFLIAAAAAMMTTAAHASPNLGSAGWASSSGESAKSSRAESAPALQFLLRYFNLKAFATTAAAPTRTVDKARDPHMSQYECEQAKEEELERMAQAKRAKSTGPEPVYLAF